MTNNNKIINDKSKYVFSNSGLYDEPFFTKVSYLFEQIRQNYEYDCVEYNRKLFKKYSNCTNDEIESYFWEVLDYWTIYFKPAIYDEKVAYLCNLIPFKYNGQYEELELLALGGCGMDLSPKLDAYQALTSNSIDENSRLFTDKDYFEYVVGKSVTRKVLRAITKL